MNPIHLQPKNQKKIFEEGDFLDKKVKELLCNHEWEVIDKRKFQTDHYEVGFTRYKGMLNILVQRCKKCGKVKKDA